MRMRKLERGYQIILKSFFENNNSTCSCLRLEGHFNDKLLKKLQIKRNYFELKRIIFFYKVNIQ